MKLSTKGRYGVTALYELAACYGDGPVSLRCIAERHGLSEHYLEQLVAPLRRAGLIVSARGAQGGYGLGRPPQRITVGDILRVLEGSWSGSTRTDDPPVSPAVWRCVAGRLESAVADLTLAQLVTEVEPAPPGQGRPGDR